MASAALNEESVEKRLMSVTNTQDSIQGLSLWIIHHKTHHERIVELWYKVLKKTVKPSHRLTLFYLCNDVVQTCKRKKATVYIDTFKSPLKQAAALVRDLSIKTKIERIFNIWEERQVFDKDLVAELRATLDGRRADGVIFKKPHSHSSRDKSKGKGKSKEKQKEKKTESPPVEEYEAVQPADATLEPDKDKEKSPDSDAPSEETLAAFKPTDMIEKVRTFKHQEAEVEIKVQQLSHLKLDASSIEAIKHLKDRAHGNEFSTQFEESCQRLEEAVRGFEKKNGEQQDLMAQLRISEYFYDQQYREARIVVNAYKNYGARINTMKRKVDELIRTLPSPEPSPTNSFEVPSPGSTPPGLGVMDADVMDLDSADTQALPEQGEVTTRGRVAHTTTTPSILKPITSIKELIFADDDIPSPPDEAPSPGGSSPDDSALQVKGSSSLENRLASFIPSLQSGKSVSPIEREERPIPVYVPQPLNSNGNISARRPSANKTLTEPEVPFPEEAGGSTPLTDEQPSTPVMDEEPPESDSPPPPPPPEKKKKENPIDFLSRLISQTQTSKPVVASGSTNFLESFSMLTNKVKEQIESKKSNMGEEDSNSGGSPGPKSWKAWKAEKAVEEGLERAEPPDVSIPPPPIPSFVVPPPPPPASIAPPVPPLGLPPIMPLPVPPPDMTNPTSPFFQHTSPGQKENWPEVDESVGDGGDPIPSPNIVYPPVQGEMPAPPFPPLNKPVLPVKGILRKTGHSVLKELTPSSEDSPASSSNLALPPPPPPPIITEARPAAQTSQGDGSAITTLGSGSNSEAQEFREKLKRKTSVGGTSPAYIPNPIRPNLMTLTPGGEMDMDLDDEEEDEEDEEEEDESTRIPVLSSIVRRVDPTEQKQAREKEMQQLRDVDKHEHPRELRELSSSTSSTSSQRGSTFHKERRYSRENSHDNYYSSSSASSSTYDYRDSRSYGYDSEQPDPYYQPYSQNSQNFYGDGRYNAYGYGQFPSKRPFHKHGNHGGGGRRNYHY